MLPCKKKKRKKKKKKEKGSKKSNIKFVIITNKLLAAKDQLIPSHEHILKRQHDDENTGLNLTTKVPMI